jgi:hypothetical protein
MLSFNHTARNNKNNAYEDYPSDDATASVATYNEDDLTHLLYVDYSKTPAGQGNNIIINAVERNESSTSTPLETPSWGAHTPATHHGDNESAILSDYEMESDYEILPSASRRRGGTMSVSDMDFEWPVFLGRQEEPQTPEMPSLAPLAARPKLLRKVDPAQVVAYPLVKPNCVCAACTASRNGQMVPHNQVAEIVGPLMSWWPAPLEGLEYDWAEDRPQTLVRPEQHLREVDGPLMTWWPAPAEMLEYEWTERFYE